MAGQTDLQTLLRNLAPQRRPGRFVFVTVDRVPDGIELVACVREDEGTTLVVEQAVAEAFGLAFDYVAAMITLQVRSSLDAVGLTAAVASVLSGAGISCNVVSGFFHDHLFVPVDRGDEAIALLGHALA